MKVTKPNPITKLQPHFELSTTMYSLSVPNDGKKYTYVHDPSDGTASWQWNNTSGHTVTLHNYLPTMDGLEYSTAGKSKRMRMIRDYGDAMLVHEIKGHGALSTRNLVDMGKWCTKHKIHPELLNLFEDARIEAALSAKRPSDTKSMGKWINHLGMEVIIPKKADGGDYGWRKAYWHKYNSCPNVTESPEHLFSAFIWAERIRGLESNIHTKWCDKYEKKHGASFTPEPSVWGSRFRPSKMYKFVYDIFKECRKWKKYTTTESLMPLMMRWQAVFPRPPEGISHPGGKDVIIRILQEGGDLKDPWGNRISLKLPTPEKNDDVNPETPTTGKSTKDKDDKDSDESPEHEELSEHDKPEEATSSDDGESVHDRQSEGLGDGGESKLAMDIHTVENGIPIEGALPAWVHEFAKRDADFGSDNEKLPADFF